MGYVKVGIPDTVYHLTKKNNVDSILKDGKIKRFNDSECWFCRSKPDMLRYMQMTVLCEGKLFVDVNGCLNRYGSTVYFTRSADCKLFSLNAKKARLI